MVNNGSQSAEKSNARVSAVESEIRKMILSGQIMHGDPFPPERVLAKKLGVSRNTVREAYNSLDAMGIIKTIQGSGRYLMEGDKLMSRVFDTRQLVEKYSTKEMSEARIVIEVGIASLAAARATREDKLLLQENMRAMRILYESGTVDREKFTRLDYQFHYYLAVISNNSILREIIDALKDIIQTTAVSINDDTDRAARQAYHWHNQLLDAVCENNPDKASYAMSQHLHAAQQLYGE